MEQEAYLANYGGFETAVDKISEHFVKRGFESVVFCRESSADALVSEDQGRKLVYVKGSKQSKLDTVVSSIQTGIYLLKNRKSFDYIFWFNNANFPGIILSLFTFLPMSINTDGLEWRREKWSWPFKLYYIFSSWFISRMCKSLVSDSIAIQTYYYKHFQKKTSFIPYGGPDPVYITPEKEKSILASYGLKKGKYFLQITRLEPENLPLKIVEGFKKSKLADKGYQFLLIGFKESNEYTLKIKKMSGNDGISVQKSVYDQEILYTLRKNCYCYVHGNSVGGTNPAFLEAMATSPRLMAIDCEFSREVLEEKGLYFTPENIHERYHQSLMMEDNSFALKNRIENYYRWDAVSDSYIDLALKKKVDYLSKLQHDKGDSHDFRSAQVNERITK